MKCLLLAVPTYLLAIVILSDPILAQDTLAPPGDEDQGAVPDSLAVPAPDAVVPEADDSSAEAEGKVSDEADLGSAIAEAAGNSALSDLVSDIGMANVRQKVDTLYSSKAVYESPFGRFEGRDQIVAHFEALFENMDEFASEVKEEFVSGDETVSIWQVTIKHRKLASGDPVTIDVVSHVRQLDGAIVSQRDSFDLGTAVYEHLPVIGRVLRWVRGCFDGS